jgi:AhpD family alkylhydroperoxidase
MPKLLDDFKKEFPDTWQAYGNMKDACDQEGPLDTKTVELIKIGISTAMEHQGGVFAHVSQARKAGATPEEIYHAVLLATGLAGFPAALAAFASAKDSLES